MTMELPVALIILFITLIVLLLAVYLLATIIELLKINSGLDEVLGKVGEIATKTAPVNGVLDAVNTTLLAGRNLLEGLFYQKAGPDAAGLVESAFPGEGPRFLQRIGRAGTVVPIGEDYPRGAAILNSLLGVAPAPAAPAAAPAASGPTAEVRSGGRISLRGRSAPSAGATVVEEASIPGRLSAKGSRPWER
jgi:hypothetical protein